MVNLGNDWQDILAGEFDKEYYKILRGFLKTEYENEVVYPSMYDIFNALRYTAYKDVKVVIIGQDPYHGKNQAHGLCFSVKPGVRKPPSLVNIFKELNTDLGIPMPQNGCLEPWANKAYCCSTPFLLCVKANQCRTKAMVGKPLQMKYYENLTAAKTPLYSCFGVLRRALRVTLSPTAGTTNLKRPTLRRCRHTMDFLDANIFQKPMRF